MKSSFRPFVLPVGFAAPLLFAAMAGCGGGGGSSSPSHAAATATPTATPTPTTASGSCTATSYTPNYVASIPNLQTWPGFPLKIFLGSTDDRTRALTIRGFNQWVTATGGRTTYTLVNSASDADITVSFGLLAPGQQELGVTTVYYFQGQTEIQNATIQFNFYPTDTTEVTDVDDVNQSVAAHEFGHALGIGGHSPNRADLMFASATGGLEQVTTRDLNTLRTAYCDKFPTLSANRVKPQGGVLLKRVIS